MKNKRRVRVIFMVGTVSILIVSFFLATRYFGPRFNDKYASEQMNVLYNVIPNSVEKIESSYFVGKLDNEDEFVIWIGTVIKTNLSYDEISTSLESWKVPQNTEIIPYELELANRLRFSGVQKEFWDTSSQGLYFVGRIIKPPTIFDFRNS